LRVEIYRSFFDVTEHEAEKRIRLEDREKAAFVRRLFNGDINDPENYDLVVNLAGLTPEMAMELIIQAAKQRVAAQLTVEPKATLKQHVEVMTRHRRPVRPEVVERHRVK